MGGQGIFLKEAMRSRSLTLLASCCVAKENSPEGKKGPRPEVWFSNCSSS